jgi:hypothetical protein
LDIAPLYFIAFDFRNFLINKMTQQRIALPIEMM